MGGKKEMGNLGQHNSPGKNREKVIYISVFLLHYVLQTTLITLIKSLLNALYGPL